VVIVCSCSSFFFGDFGFVALSSRSDSACKSDSLVDVAMSMLVSFNNFFKVLHHYRNNFEVAKIDIWFSINTTSELILLC
jgi:hypothetical protein